MLNGRSLDFDQNLQRAGKISGFSMNGFIGLPPMNFVNVSLDDSSPPVNSWREFRLMIDSGLASLPGMCPKSNMLKSSGAAWSKTMPVPAVPWPGQEFAASISEINFKPGASIPKPGLVLLRYVVGLIVHHGCI
jgi:hypothetical protein